MLPDLFFLFYFWDRVSLALSRPASNSWSYCLCLWSSWHYRCAPDSLIIYSVISSLFSHCCWIFFS
jgi:hypothetical protein